MHNRNFCRSLRLGFLFLCCLFLAAIARGQGAKHSQPESRIADRDADHEKERDGWFLRGRLIAGKNSAELRHRAYRAKMLMRSQRLAATTQLSPPNASPPSPSSSPDILAGAWTPLGPVPLASDASGVGLQDYHQVSGRATAVVIDPADPSGNTVYIGGAQGGVWKSTNAANPTASSVTWSPLTDDQATLSIGAIAIQPGNTPGQSLILVGTGEANDSEDSYFGLGILSGANAGSSWSLATTANNGALSFSGLGAARMTFSTTSGQTSTVVAAMATTNVGMTDGAITTNTARGLYTSQDAGQTWLYDSLLDPGGTGADATSATSVVFDQAANGGDGIFFAAIRYHGLYSSSDGLTWTRLANQPGTALTIAACPTISTSNGRTCPIFRGEITVVPGRDEVYVWIISLDANGNPVDGGIWQSVNGGAWAPINDSGITNCGDSDGCGVEQGYYNLALMAMPNGQATDLYAGAINLYKCSISINNPNCNNSGFINLTHVYGCDPIAAPSHVHPDQHAMAFMIPASGSDAGNALIYFANDGGIYRALNGYAGLSSGSCSTPNAFDDLNQNLGSMTQFVTFSQHPSDPNTLLGGTQDNGSPATPNATTSTSWLNVNGGDGGFNAIDPSATSNWYTSNPDVPPGGLNIQECSNGANCLEQNFAANVVVGSNDVGGDDGAFYFPYILDPQSMTSLIVGTCRVWRGPRSGGAYTVLSPNFDTLGSGLCSGDEVNLVRALAAGGPTDSNGSEVIYATTDGQGPLTTTSPTGGNVWVTTNATAGIPAFTQVTQNIDPSQFPISAVAIDSSDATGQTAYVTIMGFTGAAGHIWKTTNAGATWTDFTGTTNPLPDAPANAVVVDPTTGMVFVGTDVGVFASSTTAPTWTEVGETGGFLPNVAVTALAIFNPANQSSGNQKLLRASTYGRGVWQFNLNPVPGYQLAISPPSQTISQTQTAPFNGTITSINGYSNSITLHCMAAETPPPSTCTLTPPVVNNGSGTFTLTAGGAVGEYSFNVQGVGSDPNNITHQAAVSLNICSTSSACFVITGPGTTPVINSGANNATIPITITSNNSASVTLACTVNTQTIPCSVNPPVVSSFPTSANITINTSSLAAGNYSLSVTGTAGGASAPPVTVAFNVADFALSHPQPISIASGAQGTAALTITPSSFYSGQVNASCNVTALTDPTCSLSPPNPIIVGGSPPAPPLTATIGVGNTAAGTYNVTINVQDSTGEPSHTATVAVTVLAQNFSVSSSSSTQTVTAGQTASYNLTVAPTPSGSLFTGPISLSCPSTLPTGMECMFSPQTVTPNNSTANVVMTLSTTALQTPAGTYTLPVTATSGSLSNSTNVSLSVTQVTRDFSLAIAPPGSANTYAGNPAKISLTLTSSASTSTQVTVMCNDSSISGAQSCSPTAPITLSPGASVPLAATINIPSNTPTQTYPIIFTASDPTGSQTANFQITIVPDFTVINATPPQTITAGQTTGAYQLSIAPNPPGSTFPNAVSLGCSGLPAGAQCIFNPSTPQTPGPGAVNIVLTVSTTAATTTSQLLPAHRRPYLYAFSLLLPAIALLAGRSRHLCRSQSLFVILSLLAVSLSLISCGGSPSATTSSQGTPPGSYIITITGTSSGTPSANASAVLNIE